jgi:hypothetical protein
MDISSEDFSTFYNSLRDTLSVIPDKIIDELLNESGCYCLDPRAKRLIGLAAEKFILDILEDAHHLTILEKDKVFGFFFFNFVRQRINLYYH